MKVLFVYYLPSGGVETLNRERCLALKEAGVSCELLYMQQGSGYANIRDIPVYVTNNDQEIKALIEKNHYTLIMVCSDHLFLKRIRSLGYKGKLIYEIQGLGTISEAERWMQKANQHVKTYADAIFYPRTPHLAKLVGKYIPNFPVYSFHNCFDTDRFKYSSSSSISSVPIIGWVGRLESNKNWRGFLEYVFELRKKQPHLVIWMFHDPTLAVASEKTAFEITCSKLRLKDIITCYSNVPNVEMAKYFSMIGDSGGFLCSTSLVEGFGYALVEAISCHCPVVTTDSDGVRSFVLHNQSGKLIDLSDMSDAVNQGIDLLTNKTLRNALKFQAKNHIAYNLDPKKYASRFIDMMKNS
ncbi:glycosyltransferase family 4 protein [Anaerobacillus sp. 1_MG-2023]|uniref:glycosyltransferase family 4 protein n=1 Tax=Anaerobacillus sp. 1_MG-2023 TaxID=3062655 RepID=UPI0026E1E516|nr:glycosyltransferase family 4 protein [Anaerobacillus sp. 1_MG-2023]MDO6657630.1 glycosyltransferase family 4 protein [Anaerobacillus sp. 1_MG-2023]